MMQRRSIDLRSLPKLRDGLTYIHIERGRIERDDSSIAWYGPDGAVALPAASLSVLMLGPGVTITHAAVVALADNGASIAWVGEGAVRFYASGTGETRSARNLEMQARAWASEDTKLEIAKRLYTIRFPEPLDPGLTLQQIRGKEGVRVRTAYSRAAKEYGVKWRGRNYDRDAWSAGDTVNRALSAGNSCLYGVCHAAIVSLGFSPALGFLHSGKQLSFVYDIADLYKADLVVPAAFGAASVGGDDIERRVRLALRDEFRTSRFLERVAKDLLALFKIDEALDDVYDNDAAKPGEIWDGGETYVEGGVAYGRDDT